MVDPSMLAWGGLDLRIWTEIFRGIGLGAVPSLPSCKSSLKLGVGFLHGRMP